MTLGGRELYRVYGRVSAGGCVRDAPALRRAAGQNRCATGLTAGPGLIVHPLFELPDLSGDIGQEDVFFLLAQHNVAPGRLCASCYPIGIRARYAGWINKARAGQVDLDALAAKHHRPAQEGES